MSVRDCVFKGKKSNISFFKRDLKLGAAAHGSEGEIFHSNLQSLAESCQHGASPADRLSAGLMLPPLTNLDSPRQTVYPFLCLT